MSAGSIDVMSLPVAVFVVVDCPAGREIRQALITTS